MSDTSKYYSLWDELRLEWVSGYRSIGAGYPTEWQTPSNDRMFALTYQECETWRYNDWGWNYGLSSALEIRELPPELLEKALAYQKSLHEKRVQFEDQKRRQAHADKYL